MSIKRILAPVLGNDNDKRVLEAAFACAAIANAHVQVLFLCRDPNSVLMMPMGDGATGEVIDTLIKATEELNASAEAKARAAYDTWRNAHSIAEASGPAATVSASFAVDVGNLDDIVKKAGRLSDVVCVVRPGEGENAERGVVLQAALLDTGKATLVVPETGNLGSFKNIAVAWNASREAAGAVAQALPLIEASDSVVVLTGLSGKVSVEDAGDFAGSLKWHGIEAAVQTFTPRDEDLADQIQEEAAKAGADLLVLGAYSHNRLQEFVFGGVTDDLVQAGEIPIFMTS